MKFILTRAITDTKHEVTSIHQNSEILPDDLKKKGFEVNEIPERPQEVGKSYKMYFNPITQEVFYEPFERPKTAVEQEFELIKQRQELMQQALDELLLGGM
jgi:hypothetical protein